MSAQTIHPTTERTSLARGLTAGAAAGVLASLAMAAFAMVAALTYQGVGFFTPLHHIASVFVSPQPMMTSMEGAMAGSPFLVTAGAALLGAVVHMVTGAAYGATFGLLAVLARLKGAVLVAAGVVFGLLVFAVSAFVGLPAAAALFDSGDQIADMATMVGFGTFITEHLLHGLVLGLVLLALLARGRRDHSAR